MEENFDKIKILIASDDKIRSWSRGEVKKPETINYRSLKPEENGLFCEKIFGPVKDWECHCGKYKRVRYKGIICDRCGVEITKSKVRRERMGHIELAAPVAHIWYFKGIPNRIALMLDVSPKALERVIYFAAYIVMESSIPEIKKNDILNETEYWAAIEEYGSDKFVAKAGAEALEILLKEIDLEKLTIELRKELEEAHIGKKGKVLKRLDTVESFLKSGSRPEWMIKNVVAVIPPDLRPMVQLDGGRFATSDLNDLYRRLINRNNRLKRLIELGAPEIILKNEKRMLQESVDALFDNTKRSRPITGAGNRPLKSLSDILKGKQGRFRQNLLGKRVDYSGRSVIVVGPELKLNQCGLPKEMAVELFKPFIMRDLIKGGFAQNIKSAKRMVETLKPEVWDILEEVIKDHPVLLNRAPTLHRLGIQAFEPVLVEGRAIKLHPLACTAFNADFDGDQMAVHLPLSPEAQAEARYLLLSTNNLLKPQNGEPVVVPTQDMILGAYYLTMVLDNQKGEGSIYKDKDEAMMAYLNGDVTLQAKIKVRVDGENGEKRIIDATVGRIIYNEGIPQDLGFVDRSNPLHKYDLEINFPVVKSTLKKIITKCINKHGFDGTVPVLDFIKATGYKYSTKAAITVSIADVHVPEAKKDIIREADAKIDQIYEQYNQGILSEEDKYELSTKLWTQVTNDVTKIMEKNFDSLNPVYMMATSGARGNISNIRQLAGMRGLMADTSGKAVEIPIKSSFREGLDSLEYFISTHGARKGLADTALRTAKSGYLTRRLVDVAQDIVIREDDCDTHDGIVLHEIVYDGNVIESLEERIEGRYLSDDLYHPETKELLCDRNTLITDEIASKIVESGIKEVKVRSASTCTCKEGICKKCYGKSLVSKGEVHIGEAVGIIAAQAIGEPGTQLTMRTFHTGGVASSADITQGLPRVEELFEARKPKGVATISEIDGEVSVHVPEDKTKALEIIVKNDEETKVYIASQAPFKWITNPEKDAKGKIKKVYVKAGEPLTEGSINPNDLLKVKGINEVYKYITEEIQKAYRSQSVEIKDKHIEVIIRQMLRKVRILDPGDADIIGVGFVEKTLVDKLNEELEAEGKRKIEAIPALLGISKASISTESFLSAASFQETTRVLTDASIKGKIDDLAGLKENIIIGKLIPAGTGLKKYKNIQTNTSLQDKALAKIKMAKAEQERYELQKKQREKFLKQEQKKAKAEEKNKTENEDKIINLDDNFEIIE